MATRPKSKNPSLTTRRNLWKSKTEEKKYARDARAFISRYGSHLKDLLERTSHTDANGKTTVDIAAFQQEMERIESLMLTTQGKTITDNHAKQAMILGIQYSDKTLKDERIDDGK